MTCTLPAYVFRSLPALVAVGLLLLSAAAPATAEEAATHSGFGYGVIVTSLDNAPAARSGGFTLMSSYVAWENVEPSRGQFVFEQKDKWGRTAHNDLSNVIDTARASGLRVGLRLDQPPAWAGGAVYRLSPADVEDYVYHAVSYAGGTIAYVEVFNELNLPLEWGTTPVDPAAYALILAGAARGAKRADPSVTVVSAAPSQRTGGLGGTMEDVDWLNGLYDAGGAASFDALGMHAYLGNFDPSTDPACTPMCFRDLELYRSVMTQHGDSARSAMITEFGALEQTDADLGQYTWMELRAETRAGYLVQALHMANAQYPWLIGATMFNLDYGLMGSLPKTSERYWFSLLTRSAGGDVAPSLAYIRIKAARASGYLPD